MDGEIEAIVAKLTKAQRYLLRDPYGSYGQFDETQRARFGLITQRLIESGQGLRVTPLGLRVRQALETAGEGSRG